MAATPERMDDAPEWQRLAEWFEAAQALPPEQRDAFVRNAPLSDSMRRELASLLQHAPRAEQFFGALQQAVSDAPSLADDAADFDEPSPADPYVVGSKVAHFELTAELGRGGMGVVYRATDVRLQRPVALKLLRTRPAVPMPANTTDSASTAMASVVAAAAASAATLVAADERARRKLLAEARTSASLDHPNICTVYEVGETHDQVPYIAMAYYAGETLESRLKRGALPIATALDYAAQMASGLQAAHDRGIVHRDVKPANMLVTEQGVIKLLDFGIARDLSGNGPRTTPRGFTPGTVSYMSPEQVAGHHVDQRTDLWSLGVVLYEMLTGTRPFTTKQFGGMLYDIAYTPAPLLSTMRADVPAHVQQIVSKLLAKAPAQRYGSARELLHDLTHPPPEVADVAVAAPEPVPAWRRLLARFGVRGG